MLVPFLFHRYGYKVLLYGLLGLFMIILIAPAVLGHPHTESIDFNPEISYTPISILLSETCIFMIHFSTGYNDMSCPTYLDLSMYDTYSEPYYGEVYPTSIIGERYEENYNLSPRHYSILNTTLILADPPINMLLNSKSITIQPRVLVAHTTNMSDTSTRSIQIEQKMYINDACDRAIIAADHWEEMLPITIVNMLYNCSPAVYDPYDTTIMIPHPLVPYTHDESISYQTLLHWRMVAEQCSTGYQVCR